MLDGSTDWDHQKVERILPFDKHQMLQIKPTICNASDELLWLKTASGEYSSKSGYITQSEINFLEETVNLAKPQECLANV